MAAIAAKRTDSQARVVLIANGTHVGGFTSGGHCGNDMYVDAVFGGLAREFWDKIYLHYGGNKSCEHKTGGYCKYTVREGCYFLSDSHN